MIKGLFTRILLVVLLTLGVMVATPGASTAWAADLPGQWYGSGYHYLLNAGAPVGMFLDPDNNSAIVNIPEIGLFHQTLPANFGDDSFTIWAGENSFTGTADGDFMSGGLWYRGFQVGEWYAYREIKELPEPGPGPGPSTGDLPPLYCVADAVQCTELVPFDPDLGPGYIDYPLNGESWEDQYRSYIRRDLMRLVKYAAAKVEVKTADWDYWDFAPIGLMDMSEADGSIPGTSDGNPGHPPGTHEDGKDIDIAYYQLYAPDNSPRIVGEHYDGYNEAYRCVDIPYALDPWRTALFISYLSEHPHVRVIGVDGQVGLVLEEALDDLVSLNWINVDHRAAIPLAYEVVDMGRGWYLFHHHHMHVSMMPIGDVLSVADLKPDTMNRYSPGRFVTGHIEIAEEHLPNLHVSQIDLSTVSLIIDEHTLVPADMSHATVTDYNSNGIPDLAVNFDRQRVTDAIGQGQVTVAITGFVDDGSWTGMFFQGTDTIFVPGDSGAGGFLRKQAAVQ